MGKLTELHAGSLVIIGHLYSKIRWLKAEINDLIHVDTRERCLENDHILSWTLCESNDSLPVFSRDGLSMEMLQSGSQVIISHLQSQIRVFEMKLINLKSKCQRPCDIAEENINLLEPGGLTDTHIDHTGSYYSPEGPAHTNTAYTDTDFVHTDTKSVRNSVWNSAGNFGTHESISSPAGKFYAAGDCKISCKNCEHRSSSEVTSDNTCDPSYFIEIKSHESSEVLNRSSCDYDERNTECDPSSGQGNCENPNISSPASSVLSSGAGADNILKVNNPDSSSTCSTHVLHAPHIPKNDLPENGITSETLPHMGPPIVTDNQPPGGETTFTVMFSKPAYPAHSCGVSSSDTRPGCKMKHFKYHCSTDTEVNGNSPCKNCNPKSFDGRSFIEHTTQHATQSVNCSGYGTSLSEFKICSSSLRKQG